MKLMHFLIKCGVQLFQFLSNIAEGQGRDSTRDYIRFLNIARGSCFELETQINACVMIEYLSENDVKDAFNLLNEICKMLTAIINKLKTSLQNEIH